MNRYEMEPTLNPSGRFVIYGDHLNAIEKLEARVEELESKPDYSSEAVSDRDRFRNALVLLREAIEAHKCRPGTLFVNPGNGHSIIPAVAFIECVLDTTFDLNP